jgi:hypothetical protein
VSDTPSPPGAPPLPPPDFDLRDLAVREIAPGTVLYRIHRSSVEALYFGPRTRPDERGRWDAPDDSYGVCYLAEQGHTAVAETLLRELDREEVSQKGDLAPRSLARVRVERTLVLARMHGQGLRRMKATAAVVQGPYETTWRWSRAIHDHRRQVDGIAYRARHDDDDLSVALFDRAAGAVTVLKSTPLLHPALAGELGSWLDRYGIGLNP